MQVHTTYESWEHWDTLCDQPWFKPYILRWRRELEAKIKSLALERILKKANDGDFQAN